MKPQLKSHTHSCTCTHTKFTEKCSLCKYSMSIVKLEAVGLCLITAHCNNTFKAFIIHDREIENIVWMKMLIKSQCVIQRNHPHLSNVLASIRARQWDILPPSPASLIPSPHAATPSPPHPHLPQQILPHFHKLWALTYVFDLDLTGVISVPYRICPHTQWGIGVRPEWHRPKRTQSLIPLT